MQRDNPAEQRCPIYSALAVNSNIAASSGTSTSLSLLLGKEGKGNNPTCSLCASHPSRSRSVELRLNDEIDGGKLTSFKVWAHRSTVYHKCVMGCRACNTSPYISADESAKYGVQHAKEHADCIRADHNQSTCVHVLIIYVPAWPTKCTFKLRFTACLAMVAPVSFAQPPTFQAY